MNDYVKQWVVWIIVMAVGLLANPSIAAEITWDGGGVDDLWSTEENWSTDQVPTADDEVWLDASVSQGPVIDGTVTAVCDALFGPGAGAGTQAMQISGGTLGVDIDWTLPGSSSPEVAVGHVEISDGTITVGNILDFAQDGDAYLYMTGGTLNGMYFRGSDTDANGLIIMDGGTVYMGQGIQLGGMGTMEWIVNDGSVLIPTSSADYFRVGANYGTPGRNKGYFELNGGTLNVRRLRLGQTSGAWACEGVLCITGGTATFPTDAMIGVSGANAHGTLIMEGGELNTPGLVAGAGAKSEIIMSGGTINVTGNFMDARSYATASSNVVMTGGEINTYTLRLSEYTEAPSHWIVSGGKINISSYFKLQTGTYFELKGGTVEITNTSSAGLVILDYSSGHGVIDLAGPGKLILHWDARTQIDDLKAAGKIIAYGGDGWIDVVYDSVQDITEVRGYHLFNPIPADGSTVSATLDLLQWTLPEPNVPGDIVTCDVYFGTEPNLLLMSKIVANQSVESVLVDIDVSEQYYWQITTYKNGLEDVMGPFFTFNTFNLTPEVDAGEDSQTWWTDPPRQVTMSPTVTDDGLVAPLTYNWTIVTDANDSNPSGFINPAVKNAVAELKETGIYVLQLEVYDGEYTVTDTVQVTVFADSCSYAAAQPGFEWLPGDINRDCEVDLEDLAELTGTWLMTNYAVE